MIVKMTKKQIREEVRPLRWEVELGKPGLKERESSCFWIGGILVWPSKGNGNKRNGHAQWSYYYECPETGKDIEFFTMKEFIDALYKVINK